MLRRWTLIGMIAGLFGIAVIPGTSYSAAGTHRARCAAKACKPEAEGECKKGQFKKGRKCLAKTTPEAPLAVAERPNLPLNASFLSVRVPPGAHPPRSAIEQLSLESGAPLRTLLWLPERLPFVTFAPGQEGMLWLTVHSGPKPQCEDCEESYRVPDSCRNEVLRFDPLTGELETEQTFPSSTTIRDAEPSPDGQWLLLKAESCTGSSESLHLLAINLKTGAQWTVGANATVCENLGTPAWSADSSELVVPYGPSTLPAGTTHAPGVEGFNQYCPESQPTGLAIVQAGTSSEFSTNALIEPKAGCSYESAAFDSEGIVAVEGCSEGTPPSRYTPNTRTGQAYLVQLTATGEVVHRLPLEIGANASAVQSDPETGTVLVTEDQSDSVKGNGDWVREYHDGALHLIKQYPTDREEAALPW